jgi:hopanoid biosynthesis associated protein HpnK
MSSAAPRRVIFTADDFGLSLPVNEAVERAHQEGVLRTASLMVAEAAFADAVDRARRLPRLHVGLHVALVNGRALLPSAQIPLLADAAGQLPTDQLQAGLRFFFTPGIRSQLEAEIRAQFAAFAATGLRLDHVNAQSHMHVHPTVFGLLLRVGRDYGSPPIRIPREPHAAWWLVPWLAVMAAQARRAGVAHNAYVYGLRDTGRMNRARVLALLQRLPVGVTEMYFHPATGRWPGIDPVLAGYDLEAEFAALIDPDVAAAVRAPGIEAITFADLAAAR